MSEFVKKAKYTVVEAGNESKARMMPRLNELEMKREVRLPVIEVVEEVRTLNMYDIQLSVALRIFEKYDDGVKDAIWVLMREPTKALMSDLNQLLQMRIIRDIIESGITPVADLTIVESPDAILLDEDCSDIPQRVATLLMEMNDEFYKSEEMIVRFKTIEDRHFSPDQVTLQKQTFLTRQFVESMIGALAHSRYIALDRYDSQLITHLLKGAEGLSMAMLDFFLEQMDVVLDERLVLRPVYIGTVQRITKKMEVAIQQIQPIQFDAKKDQTRARIYDLNPLFKFLRESQKVDVDFFKIFFCYLYRTEAEGLFSVFMNEEQSNLYVELASSSLECWVNNATTTMTGSASDIQFEIHQEGDTIADQTGMTQLKEVMQELYQEKEAFFKFDYGSSVISQGYVARLHSEEIAWKNEDPVMLQRELDTTIEHGPMSQGQKEVILELTDAMRLVALIGEIYRVKRVVSGDEREDSKTNEMSDLFPDQYGYFYKDFLVDQLSCAPIEGHTIITNSQYMLDCWEAKYGHKTVYKAKVDTISQVQTSYDDDTFDIMLLDLNKRQVTDKEIAGSRFAKNWMSPIGASTTGALAYLDAKMKEGNVTAWVRVPLLTNCAAVSHLVEIMTNKGHKVQLNFAHRAHDEYFDLKIYPVAISCTDMGQALALKLLVRQAKLRVETVMRLRLLCIHVAVGIRNRNLMWQYAMGGAMVNWKAERYKHLTNLEFLFSIDVGTKKVIKKIVTKNVEKMDVRKRHKKQLKTERMKRFEKAASRAKNYLQNMGRNTMEHTRALD